MQSLDYYSSMNDKFQFEIKQFMVNNVECLIICTWLDHNTNKILNLIQMFDDFERQFNSNY